MNAKQRAHESIILRMEEAMELTMLRIIGSRTPEERAKHERNLLQLVIWTREICPKELS